MKIDLTDCTFLIPVHFDHKDRKFNLDMPLCMLQKNFNTNIIVGEQGGDKFEYVSKWVTYVKFDYKHFHRTKMLNQMAKSTKTPIIINNDADCHVAPMAMLRAVEMIREGKADFVYPYEYLFVRVRKVFHKELYKHYDLAEFAPIMRGVDTRSRPSLGGIVLFNKESFFRGGGENENMVSYCPEDIERYERFTRLDFRHKRIKGHLYHLDHWCGPNSNKTNPFYKRGVDELIKIREMNREELINYVNSWEWAK